MKKKRKRIKVQIKCEEEEKKKFFFYSQLASDIEGLDSHGQVNKREEEK